MSQWSTLYPLRVINSPTASRVSNVHILIEPGHVIEEAMTVNIVFERHVGVGAWRSHYVNFITCYCNGSNSC